MKQKYYPRYSPSPVLNSKTPPWRSKAILVVFVCGFALLSLKAARIQIFSSSFYQEQGELRFARTLEIPVDRGQILDRNHLILSSNIEMSSMWASPVEVSKHKIPAASIAELAKLLDMKESALQAKLTGSGQFVWLKRFLDKETAERIQSLKIKGIYTRKEFQRQYPEGEAISHVVGFVGAEGNGLEGVESSYNDELAGHVGSRRVLKNSIGQIVEEVGQEVPANDGTNLVLSIDSKMQFFAYQNLRNATIAHKAKGGSIVVLDVTSGEILALANYPSFTNSTLKTVPKDHLRNRAVTDVFEPGSTAKPFIVALSLEKNLVKPSTKIQTAPGYLQIGNRTIKDAHPQGLLSVQEIIQKSSNVGVVKLSRDIDSSEIWNLYNKLGFGRKLQINFPGVVSGKLRPYKTWKPIEKATMSYGYGFSVSLLQLAHSYLPFARKGDQIPLTLIKSPTIAQGVQVIKPQTAQEIRQMLHMVTQNGGTAPKAQAKGYTTGGKTGTAHKQEGYGYADKKYRSFFVGMAPIETPRVIIAVMIDEPNNGLHYGGDVAAPVFSETIQQVLRILGVAPDASIQPELVTNYVTESTDD